MYTVRPDLFVNCITMKNCRNVFFKWIINRNKSTNIWKKITETYVNLFATVIKLVTFVINCHGVSINCCHLQHSSPRVDKEGWMWSPILKGWEPVSYTVEILMYICVRACVRVGGVWVRSLCVKVIKLVSKKQTILLIYLHEINIQV
jgi:hypothetical protein